MRAPAQYPLLIAAGSYRCGSTLLLRLLNTSEECHIWGEDNVFLSTLNNFLNLNQKPTNLERSNEQKKLFEKNKDSFTANMLPDYGMYLWGCYNALYSTFNVPDKKYFGFKTLFPTVGSIALYNNITRGGKVIYIYRNFNKAYKSYRDIYDFISRDEYFQYVKFSTQTLKYLKKEKFPNVYILKYEDIDVKTINDLFDWLEISNRDKIECVLKKKIKEVPNYINPMEKSKCLPIMKH